MPDPFPLKAFNAALAQTDTAHAQTLLDACQDLPALRRACLQARIHITDGRADKAIQVLDELDVASLTALPARRLRASAHLAMSEPAKALTAMQSPPDGTEGAVTLADAKLEISALAALNERDRTIACVTTALASFDDAPSLPGFAIRALCQVGALQQAAELLLKIENGLVPNAALTDFAMACFDHNAVALFCETKPHLSDSQNVVADAVLRNLLGRAETSAERTRAAGWIVDTVTAITAPVLTFQLAQRLFEHGFDDQADLILPHLRQLLQNSVDENRDFVASLAVPRKTRDRSDLIMAWLGIPPHKQANWREMARRGALEKSQYHIQLAANLDYLDTFIAQFEPADLTLLKDLAENQKPAIAIGSHVGVLPAMVQYMRLHDVDISVIGGDKLLKRLTPGGEKLIPIRYAKFGQVAKIVMDLWDQGRVVAFAADGFAPDYKFTTWHRGCAFTLPSNLPLLAFKHELPVVWIATFWRNGRIVCDCVPGPAPNQGEDLDSFRTRWFEFVLEKMHQICLFDPRNALILEQIISPLNKD